MSCLAIAAVAAHLVSAHSSGHYNNINPGLSVRTECGIVAGAYYNSQRRASAYVGYSAETRGPVAVFGSLALATGYRHPRTGKKYIVAPLPMIGVKVSVAGHWRLVGGYLPSLGPNPHVAHLMLEYRF